MKVPGSEPSMIEKYNCLVDMWIAYWVVQKLLKAPEENILYYPAEQIFVLIMRCIRPSLKETCWVLKISAEMDITLRLQMKAIKNIYLSQVSSRVKSVS